MMVKTEYICDLCESSYKENAEKYILAVEYHAHNEIQITAHLNNPVHVCLNCLRGLEKALKANWVQKLLGSSEDALDAVLEGNDLAEAITELLPIENEVWETWRNDSDRIAWARGKDYLHLWNDAKHTANSLSKLKEVEIIPHATDLQINQAWFEKVTQKLKEDLQEKAA